MKKILLSLALLFALCARGEELDITKPAAYADTIQGHKIPPARSRADAEKVIAAIPSLKDDDKKLPLKIVLCASAKDAGHNAPGFHDYPIWRERWAKILATVPGVTTETADRWPSAEQIQSADVIAFFHDNPAWDKSKAADLDAVLARGGGLVFLHWAVNAYRDPEPMIERLGRAWSKGAKFRHGPVTLTFAKHELTAGFPETAQFEDETYWNLPGDAASAVTLATGPEDGAAQPQVWAVERDKGRVFCCIPGHFTWTHDDPFYRILVYRGICWAARRPLNRLDDAVFTGARLADPAAK
jgi:type 1 glutamine amidotransferase